MAKTLSWFENQCALNSPEVMQAFLQGAKRAGYDIVPNSFETDTVVIWSALWHGRMKPNEEVYRRFRGQNKPVIFIEVGALNRGVTWKVSVNHVTAQGFYGHHNNLDPDRPRRFGVRLNYPKSSRPEILICSQHRASLQVQDQWPNQENWINDRVRKLRQYTDRAIIVRPHPRSQISLSLLESNLQVQTPKKLINTYDSFDFDVNYHAIVNHNSGPGIQAALAGIKPIVDSTSLAFPVSYAMGAIEKPYDIDREQWLIEIAHTEYSTHELAQAIWYARLESNL